MPNAFTPNDPTEPNLAIELLTQPIAGQSTPAVQSEAPVAEASPPDLPPELLSLPTMAQEDMSIGVASPDLPREFLGPTPEPVGATGDQPRAPDIPEEFLTHAITPRSPESGLTAPDLPVEFLRPAEDRTAPGTTPPGPGLPPELLAVPEVATSPNSDPVGPDLPPDLLAPDREVRDEGADLEPDFSTPLSTDAVSIVDEMTFAEKWDELSRRLTSTEFETGSDDPRIAHPPDLPQELLQPQSDDEETSGGDTGHNGET